MIKDYNTLFLCNSKIDKRRTFILDSEIDKLPNIFIIDQKPNKFEINKSLLNSININEGLTIEQAIELLKWTVENTRSNLITIGDDDLYDNASLMGACGFSQFSSLYPLQNMGFEVTINNIAEFTNNSHRHAFGTVVIPIKNDNAIVNKRFLIDCTYKQFFTIPFNVIARYLGDRPSIGYFISKDIEEMNFAKELLKNGFAEADNKNLKKYIKPFFANSLSISDIKNLDEKFKKIDIDYILNNKQSEFDMDVNDFLRYGGNLEINDKLQAVR